MGDIARMDVNQKDENSPFDKVGIEKGFRFSHQEFNKIPKNPTPEQRFLNTQNFFEWTYIEQIEKRKSIQKYYDLKQIYDMINDKMNYLKIWRQEILDKMRSWIKTTMDKSESLDDS